MAWVNDPSFWVQVAVAVGTLAVVGLAWWNERTRRREYQAARYAQALEEFVAPALEATEEIHRISQPQNDPYRANLQAAGRRLQGILVSKRARAYHVDEELLGAASFTVAVASEVADLLARLKEKDNSILDDWGSALSKNPSRKEHPKVVAKMGGKSMQLEDGQILEAVLKRMRLEDLLLFLLVDEPKGVQWTVLHGNQQVYSGPKSEGFMRALFERYSQEAVLARLPQQLDQLRLESESLVKELRKLVTDYGKKSALH